MPEKNIKKNLFNLTSTFIPSGDQPQAIEKLVDGIHSKERDQVLLGVTGSGKTFTMAHVIQTTQRPTLIIAPNKTLAAQLYGEMKTFFPENAVEYFVSYYDYYQPEAYVPRTDTYIEKETSINEQIDRMRHSATRALLEKEDVIIVASVSCIYGIGDVKAYKGMAFSIAKEGFIDRDEFIRRLVRLQYNRNDIDFKRGTFRVRGDTVELFPAHYEDRAWRVNFFGEEIDDIIEFDPLTGKKITSLETITIYSNSHYIVPTPSLNQAIKHIKKDLKTEIDHFENQKKYIEAQRISERTKFDIEMMETIGSCNGIENYSRYLTGRSPGDPPPTLFEYLPENALLIIDESHVTVPQLDGMYKGDQKRKTTLSEFGFRLPACKDNRPLKFEEWNHMRPQTIYVSATPGPWELNKTQGQIIEQIIRPTGLIDPKCYVKPTEGQIDDIINESKECIEKGYRVLVTTLTKRMAEDLTDYLSEAGLKCKYLHSDIDTLERIEIIKDLRLGTFDILVGINLLREGLDIPECALVTILDADKEGFLRSQTSLVQTIGRAARNVNGKVILYADNITGSMQYALGETKRRRKIQKEYNKENNIKPETISKNISDILESVYERDYLSLQEKTHSYKYDNADDLKKHIKKLEQKMLKYASDLEFEKAAEIRDEIKTLQKENLGI